MILSWVVRLGARLLARLTSADSFSARSIAARAEAANRDFRRFWRRLRL